MGRTTMTPAMKAARREEHAFRRGQDAAATLIRALAVPNRAAQLAVAKVLIDAQQRAMRAITTATMDDSAQERYATDKPAPDVLMCNLVTWYQEGVSDGDMHQSRTRHVPSLDTP